MRIGIVIGRIGDVDGVALETEKWIAVLQRIGHEVFLLSGNYIRPILPPERQTMLRSLSFFAPQCEWEQDRAFFFPPDDPSRLLMHLETTSNEIATQVFSWVVENKIDTIVAENACSLPAHLSMGMGIKKAVEHMGIRVVTHDHDFAWERGDRYLTPFPEVESIVKETFPLQVPHVHHAVINRAAQATLKQRYGIDSMVIPNVMDFEEPFGRIDDYNRRLLEEIGLEEDDIPLFQITRIVARKGIEVAIELIYRLADSRVKLIITGSAADDPRKGYYKQLVDLIEERHIGAQVIFAHHRVLSHRGPRTVGKKIFNLSDAYAHATACTYFSTYEGFGNAFVEAVRARTPIFVNNYKPVFSPDIGSKGFRCVLLEDNDLTDAAIREIDQVIRDPELQRDIAEHNFSLGKKHFSFEALEVLLTELFTF